MPLLEPIQWTEEQLKGDLSTAIAVFRKERMEEPLDAYLKTFDHYRTVVEGLLETTANLTDIKGRALKILADEHLLNAFRYLSGPPISSDDLKILADASLTPRYLAQNPDALGRLVEIVMLGLDRRRFPWVEEHREPTGIERMAAVVASAAMLASNRVVTQRRGEVKTRQEKEVEDALLTAGFKKVPSRTILTLAAAPGRGEFCGESPLGKRKADLIVRLWDDRVMPIECKVSNSALNSVKRLNNDAAVKAGVWRLDFGITQIVPTAVLSGVYKLGNLWMPRQVSSC